MKNQNNQPKHTQGELEVIEITEAMRVADGYEKSDAFVIRQKGVSHKNLATIHPWNDSKEFAQRIVKAVNMHDELIDSAKTAVLYLEMKGQKEIEFFGKEKYLRLKQLLKQSKGK